MVGGIIPKLKGQALLDCSTQEPVSEIHLTGVGGQEKRGLAVALVQTENQPSPTASPLQSRLEFLKLAYSKKKQRALWETRSLGCHADCSPKMTFETLSEGVGWFRNRKYKQTNIYIKTNFS